MKTTVTALKCFAIIVSIFITATGFVHGQNLVNGSFELGTNPGSDFFTISAINSTTITGWTVSSGTVDYIGGRWPAADGNRSIDLNGTLPGAISQSITGFTSGQSYHLYFFMAASPDAGVGASKSMQVNIGTASQMFTALGTGVNTNPGWSQRTLDFTASSSTMTLSFTSQSTGDMGPLVDAVSLTPVPEPAITSIAILGLGTVIFTKPRKPAVGR